MWKTPYTWVPNPRWQSRTRSPFANWGEWMLWQKKMKAKNSAYLHHMTCNWWTRKNMLILAEVHPTHYIYSMSCINRSGKKIAWCNWPGSVFDGLMQTLCSRYAPPTWTFECDEDLVHYFYDHIGKEDENLGSVKQCVTSIDVSSSSVCEGLVLFYIILKSSRESWTYQVF